MIKNASSAQKVEKAKHEKRPYIWKSNWKTVEKLITIEINIIYT